MYYILDSTDNNKTVTFPTRDALINYLEIPLKRKFNKNKFQWKEHIESLGHTVIDDYSYYQTLAEQFEMGVIRDGKRIRCDVFYAQKPNEANGD